MASRKKLLLVDDDPAVVSYLVVKLSKYYDLVSTSNPHEVVGLAQAEQPDLILCDIDMPDMGGGDVALALTDNPETAFIPMLYLTALVSPREARELEGQVGGRPGVSKRAPLQELLERIDALAR